MKLKFLGFALLAVCVCAVCCMCGSDSKTPDYEFPDGPDPDPDPQPGDYPAGLTVTEFTDDLGGGKQCLGFVAVADLKANPNKKAQGTVIESTLDKGRGYVSTILVQSGTLRVGDVILSGTYTGRVKAMFNENGKKVETAGPSTPVQVLGLNGAPQAGDTFNVMDDARSAREIANKREQLARMQGIMTQKHVTLDEIGRRIAIGSFKELNIIVKGDVDG